MNDDNGMGFWRALFFIGVPTGAFFWLCVYLWITS